MRLAPALLALVLILPPAAGAVEPDQSAPWFAALDQARGKVVLVDFWASWCSSCRQALPRYQSLRQELGGKGFEVIGVDVDRDPRAGDKVLRALHLAYPQVPDPQGRIAEQYDPPAMPTAYLLDRRGVVRRVQVGFTQNDIEPLRQAAAKLLEEP